MAIGSRPPGGSAASLETAPREGDALPALALLALGAVIHLAGLGHPRAVVFDETHFGSFVNAYACTHAYVFDIHPPHAKLLIAGVAKALGYGCGLTFTSIGQPFGASPVPLRLLPALAGAAIPSLVYVLARQLGGSRAAALFAGAVLALDNALAVHTRMIDLDGILLVAVLGAVSCWLAAERAEGARRTLLVVASGALVGLAVGTKFLGLGAALVVGLLAAVRVARERTRSALRGWTANAAAAAGAALVVYALGWVLHFALLRSPGPGYTFGSPTGHLLEDIVRTHRTMLAVNIGLTQGHPYASPWWSWPLMARPIYYWAAARGPARIYLVGNPVVWWGSTLLLVVAGVNAVLARVTALRIVALPARPPPRLWVPLAGYLAFYLPLARVPRILFMYHYFTPLVFSVVLVALWLDHARWTSPGPLSRQRASYHGAIAATAIAFLAFAPLTYGLERGAWVADAVFRVFPGWR